MRPYALWFCLTSAALWGAGCAALGESTAPLPEARESPMAGLLRERESQLAALRAKLAEAHIASAKQEAELAVLRATITELRREGIESRQRILELRQAAEVDLAAPRAVPGGGRGFLPGTESPAAESSPDWRPVVAALTVEVEQLKGDLAKAMASPREGATESSTERRSAPRDVTGANPGDQLPDTGIMAALAAGVSEESDELSLPAATHITVAPGDSLWKLARKHRTTIEELRRINHLTSTRLAVGQILILSLPGPSPSAP